MPARRRRVLVVDPDPFLAGIYARRFEQGGWNVRVCERLSDAAKALARFQPDAVLVDVEALPEGAGALRELRANPRAAGAVLVALASIGNREGIADARAAGADAYLLKGHFVPTEVRAKVERLVAARESE